MKLEDGKMYRMRNGVVVGPLRELWSFGDCWFESKDVVDGYYTDWNPGGTAHFGLHPEDPPGQGKYDIVADAEVPWDDMKVAFSIDDEGAFDAWAGPGWECAGLPDGWSLHEADSGMAVFRVEGPFVEANAHAVAEKLAQFRD
jgi:hypothetical protein